MSTDCLGNKTNISSLQTTPFNESSKIIDHFKRLHYPASHHCRDLKAPFHRCHNPATFILYLPALLHKWDQPAPIHRRDQPASTASPQARSPSASAQRRSPSDSS